jgi:hypothetical protein
MKKSNDISTNTKPTPVMTPLFALVIGVAGAAVGCAGILVYGDISESYQQAVEIEENRAERELVTLIRHEIARATVPLDVRIDLIEAKIELENVLDTGCSRC